MKNSYEKFPRWLELIETHVEREILLGISPWGMNSVMKDLRGSLIHQKTSTPPRGPAEGVQLQSPPPLKPKQNEKVEDLCPADP